MLGFETIGSATIIAYDDKPILATDAWINEDAYFGSWTHDFSIPKEQMEAIKNSQYIWFSHGHPDHLNTASLEDLSGCTILLSDHYKSRILNDLREAGLNVEVLPNRQWRDLSPNISVYSIANQNQDSVLLIRIGDRLLVDTNDSPDFGASYHIKKQAKKFKDVYMLSLHGWGGADMMNLHKPDGTALYLTRRKAEDIAPRAQRWAIKHGANWAIPFSSFHRYQRTDSVWANDFIPAVEQYQKNATKNGPTMLPAFIRVDCETGDVIKLNPPQKEITPLPPEHFGDNWSDQLDTQDKQKIEQYFRAFDHVAQNFGFVEFRVGGRDYRIDLNRNIKECGFTFEVPRSSLMTCVEYNFFDDLLIGNYMKTTLHGGAELYPNFSPYVCKYGDNGGARTTEELNTYFGHYKVDDRIGYLMAGFATNTEQVIRKIAPENSTLFKAAKKLYYTMHSS